MQPSLPWSGRTTDQVRYAWRAEDHLPIHVGILGGGNIGDTHARAASEVDGVKVVAVAGANAAKVARLAERYGAAAYPDVDALVRHRPLDVVLIGSPSGLHAHQGIVAARSGIHVLVEKPIDVEVARADELIAACREAGVKLGVFFQDRFAPDLVLLKQAVDAGAIGRPLLASARVKWWRPPEYYSESRWRGTLALDGGGALINQGIHTVDLLLWLLGGVRRVWARTANLVHPIESEDTVVATLEFESGAVATLEATTAAFPGYPRQVELTGSEGTVVVRQDSILRADLRAPWPGLAGGVASDNASASSPVVSDVRGHRAAIEDFLRALREGGEARCDGPEGRRSLVVADALYRSARSGAPVTLP
jgi:UDP-N-acetyl-2-amino-2-deoxyglucuronate dehydrogenase